jgi:protein-arginine kinase activator protein McsA
VEPPAQRKRKPLGRRLTPLPEYASQIGSPTIVMLNGDTTPVISSRTSGDRRAQMRLTEIHRVTRQDLAGYDVKPTVKNTATLRCANCAATFPPGTIELTAAALDWARSGQWTCAPCYRADLHCATCNQQITGRPARNHLGQTVHHGGCPKKRTRTT